MKWILLFLTISVLLHACGNAPPAPMPKKFQPVVNPNPNYFMTVKGHVAPELAGKVKLVWVTEYYTANPECEVVTNQFEGVRNAREIKNSLVVKPNSTGNYEYKIPLDKYLPGFCRWQVGQTLFNLGNIKENTVVSFFDPKPLKSKKSILSAECYGTNCQIISFDVGFNNYLAVSLQNHLEIILNVTKSSKELQNVDNY